MQINDLVSIFVNNGVAVAVIVYFMFRDIKFMTALTASIQELKDCIKDATKNIEERGN